MNELRKFKDIGFLVNLNNKSVTVTYSPLVYSRDDFEKAIKSHGYRIKEK